MLYFRLVEFLIDEENQKKYYKKMGIVLDPPLPFNYWGDVDLIDLLEIGKLVF